MRFYVKPKKEDKEVEICFEEDSNRGIVFIKGRTPTKENTILSMVNGKIRLYRLNNDFIKETGIEVDEHGYIQVKP